MSSAAFITWPTSQQSVSSHAHSGLRVGHPIYEQSIEAHESDRRRGGIPVKTNSNERFSPAPTKYNACRLGNEPTCHAKAEKLYRRLYIGHPLDTGFVITDNLLKSLAHPTGIEPVFPP